MTYNFELSDKPGTTGLHHIMIRLHQKGHKPARIQLPVEVEKKYWNPGKPFGKWVRSNHLRADTLNTTLEKSYTDLKQTVEQFLKKEPHLSPKDCKLRLEAGGSSTSYKNLTSGASQRAGLSPVTKLDTDHVLSGFFGVVGSEITLEEITPDLLTRYRNALLGRGLKHSSINQYISVLRVTYEQVQSKRGVSRREMINNSPFVEIDKLPAKSAPKGRLKESGLAALKQGDYTFYYPAGKRSRGRMMYSWPDWGRWCWLASFYQAGMRVGDLLRSRYEWYELDRAGYPVRLRYRMQKNGRLISLKLTEEAIAHLKLIWQAGSSPDSYLLPFLDPTAPYAPYRTYEQIRAMPPKIFETLSKRIASRTGQLNRAVRKAASAHGAVVVGGKLTNHSARHSVGDATVRAMKAGKPVSIFDFQALFGHSTVRTTEIYRGELDESSLDSAMDAIFGDD